MLYKLLKNTLKITFNMNFLNKKFLILILFINVSFADEKVDDKTNNPETVESVLRKFKLMQHTSKQHLTQPTEPNKSHLSKTRIEKFLKSSKNSNQPINPIEHFGNNFSGLDLSGLDFSNTILYKANFSGSNLTDCTFINTFLEEANFDSALLNNTIFIDSDLSRANFSNADLSNSKLSNIYAKNAKFL